MSGGVQFRIDVDDSRLQVRLDTLPKAIQQRLKATIGQLTKRLLVSVHAAQPQRTGQLRRATHAFVDEGVKRGAPWVRGRVRVLGGKDNLGARFGALEYGAPGARHRGKRVLVKAYSRSGTRVGAYTRRQPTLKEMRFLRGPAKAQRAAMIAALQDALNDAVSKS